MARDPTEGIVRNLFDLRQLENRVAGRAESLLRDLFDDIAAQITRIDPTGTDDPTVRQQRLANLIAQVAELTDTSFEDVRELIVSDTTEIGLQQSEVASEQLELALGQSASQAGVSVLDQPVSRDQIRAIVESEPFRGATLSEWAENQAESTVFQVRRQLQLGMTQNETLGDIVRRVRGRQAGREAGEVIFEGGVLDTTTRQTEAIVRTAINHTAAQSHLRTFEANEDITESYTYTAVLDSRTTMICMGLDGQVFRFDDPGRRLPPQHFGCRSVITPNIKWQELGIEPPESGTRASEDGQVSADLDFEGWLENQSEAKQNEILGPARAELFRDGKINLKDLVRSDNRTVTVEELRQRASAGGQGVPAWRREMETPSFSTQSEANAFRQRFLAGDLPPAAREFADAVDAWTNSDENLSAIKGDVREALRGGESGRGRRLVTEVQRSDAAAPELYRGVAFRGSKGQVEGTFSVGTTHRFGMSSFSSRKEIAGHFAFRGQRGAPGPHIPTVFRLEEGARAVKIENLSGLLDEREWYTVGMFEVTEVNDLGDLIEVVVRQTQTDWTE